jgi:hypothetical protein
MLHSPSPVNSKDNLELNFTDRTRQVRGNLTRPSVRSSLPSLCERRQRTSAKLLFACASDHKNPATLNM